MARQSKAFTLIELLVVISIIALLMAILMPSLSRAREQARDQACKGNLKNIGLGVLMYMQDSDFVMPNFHSVDPAEGKVNGYTWADAAGNPVQWDSNGSYWGIIFYPFVKERRVFGCPTFKSYGEMIAKDTLYGGDPKLIYYAAYGVNGWLTKENTLRIPKHSEVVFCHDHVEPRCESGNTAAGSDMICQSPTGINLTHYRQGGGRENWYRGIFRHNVRLQDKFATGGTMNILWLDAHVSLLKETTGEDVAHRWLDPLNKHP
jgi:prepilin-type N-terminal cleavage/methylation domain-containing protein/prepilin-type processing-associated H-X9-DG protein